jgi:hypothetical protein
MLPLHWIEIIHFTSLIRHALQDLLCELPEKKIDQVRLAHTACSWVFYLLNWIVLHLLFSHIDTWYGALIKCALIHLSIFTWRLTIWDYIFQQRVWILQQLARDQVSLLMDLTCYCYAKAKFLANYLQVRAVHYQTQFIEHQTKK